MQPLSHERSLRAPLLARLEDDGSVRSATLQARNDLKSAQMELRQKRVGDPTRGLPPTSSELAAGRAAVQAAQDKPPFAGGCGVFGVG